jgi:beta-ketoacyl ACP synthase
VLGEVPDVVITGVAMTTALATSAEDTWSGLIDGRSGIRALSGPFVEELDLPVRIGGQLLEDFDSELSRVELRRLSYLQKMAVVLSRRAWLDCGAPEMDPNRLAVSVGAGFGNGEEMILGYIAMRDRVGSKGPSGGHGADDGRRVWRRSDCPGLAADRVR